MSENKINMDSWLSEKMESLDHQVSEQEWTDFEKVYFKQKKQRKGLLFWFLFAGLTLFGIYYMNQLTKHDVVNKNKAIHQKSENKNSSTLGLNTHPSTIEDHSMITDDNTSLVLSNKKYTHSPVVPSNNESLRNQTYTNVADKKTSPAHLDSEGKKPFDSESTQTIKQELNTMSENKDSLVTIKVSPLKADSSPSVEEVSIEKKRKLRKENKHPIYITGDFYDAFSQEVYNLSSLNGLNLKPNSFQNRFIELDFGVKLNQYISIQTGIGSFKTAYQTVYNQQLTNITPTSSQVTNLNIDTATKKIKKVVYTVTQFDTSYTSKTVEGRVESAYIYLPISVQYEYVKNRLIFGVNGGFNYYIKSSTSYEGEGLNQLVLSPKAYKSINLGLDIGYKISKHFSIKLGLYQMSFINNDYKALSSNQRLYSAHTSFKYTF